MIDKIIKTKEKIITFTDNEIEYSGSFVIKEDLHPNELGPVEISTGINEKSAGYLGKINLISQSILEGKVIVLPAKTVYGLSCRYDSEESLKKVYEIKGRKEGVPFIILISDLKDIEMFADISSLDLNEKEGLFSVIDYYWNKKDPDPLTIVFKKNPFLKSFITGGKNTVAIRRSEFKFVRDIIDFCGPIISTSATLSSLKASPAGIDEIPDKILDLADLVVRLKSRLLGLESTIADFSNFPDKPTLIRQGAVAFDDVLQKMQIKI